ncbi:MAG: hypothetical protein M5R40_08380 [Anaerolineae bacterium]|nr:hypothetical protein [Anaerolineae bacterium]
MRRPVAVTFDDGQTEQTVQYAYDAGGLRTRLTLPDGLTVTYTYDVRGQLVSLTDWDRQTTRCAHDLAGRLIAATRASGLRSRYAYDGAGRLRLLRHSAGRKTLGHFAFDVDARGNRTRAFECVPHPFDPQDPDTVFLYNDDVISYRGAWTDADPYMVTTQVTAWLAVMCFGDEGEVGTDVELTLGQGPDHGICDIYVGNTFWQSVDNHAAQEGDNDIYIPVKGEGPYRIEIRNRGEKRAISTGYKLRFKSLKTKNHRYDLHTIEYAYDALARVLSADYYPGANLDATPFRQYGYTYDLAGNRTQEVVDETTTEYEYNDANQITRSRVNGGAWNEGYTYDANGNLTHDGTNAYVWDRANRLLSMGGASYAYDGLGNRVQQTVNSVVTKYLLDTQPGLAVVLKATTEGNNTHFIHGPRGLHAQQQPNGDWVLPVQDALGSVRGVADATIAMRWPRCSPSRILDRSDPAAHRRPTPQSPARAQAPPKSRHRRSASTR